MLAHASTGLFAALCRHVGRQPRASTGEVWIACPKCKRADNKFSFNEQAGHCFLCGYNASLTTLADELGLRDNRPTDLAPLAPAAPKPPKPWQKRPYELAANFAVHPLVVQKWLAYKPLRPETIRRKMLGYGVFPGGLRFERRGWQKCTHPRLIVPLVDGEQIVGFRCRAVECDCTKWLSPANSRMVLYNIESVRTGQPCAIVENTADADLIGDHWSMAAVATCGVSIWNDTYTAALKAARPSEVIVAYDNDVPGQTTNPAIIRAWKKQRVERGLPDDETQFLAGIRLAERLRAAGLKATFYRWPVDAPDGADIGGLFK